MSYFTTNSQRTGKLNISTKVYTNELKKYIPTKKRRRWRTHRTDTIPKLSKWSKTVLSPNVKQNEINQIPNELFLMKKKFRRNGTRNNMLFKRMTPKDKEIMVSKLKEKQESLSNSKRRKKNLRKQILDNIFFKDLSGDSHSLGSLYKKDEIPDKISNKKIEKLVKKLFNITDTETKINFMLDTKPMPGFKLDFNTKNDDYIQFLFEARVKPINIIILYS